MPTSAAAREAWALMGTLFMHRRRDWAASFAELGLAPMQALALHHLDLEAPMHMTALADVLRCDNSNVTGIVDRLEAQGLVERRTAPHDRRIKTLVVTPRGREVRAQVEQRLNEPPAPIARLSAADARALRDILRRAVQTEPGGFATPPPFPPAAGARAGSGRRRAPSGG